MLRALLAVLVLANLAFLGWTQGWFAPIWPPPAHGTREPERLAAQVHPERVEVLAPQAASEALAAAAAASAAARRQCLVAGPFDDAQLAAAEAVLAAASLPAGSWAREPVEAPPPVFVVFIPRSADAEIHQARLAGLRQREIAFEEISAQAEPGLGAGLVLGRHATRDAADAALADYVQRGVRAARVVALPPPPPRHWLRAPQADAALRARLAELRNGALGEGFVPCPKAP